jgi:hypothetical protein
MKFTCYFTHKSTLHITELRNIFEAQNGFWVDENMQCNPNAKCYLWIPPHKVEYLEAKE